MSKNSKNSIQENDQYKSYTQIDVDLSCHSHCSGIKSTVASLLHRFAPNYVNSNISKTLQ